MIKKWHIYFVCIFAVILVSLFFVLDAFTTSTSKSTQTIITTEQTESYKYFPTITATPESNNKISQSFGANDGYKCYQNAMTLLDKEQYYTYNYMTVASALSNVQKINGMRYFNDKQFYSQIYAYSTSVFGQVWFEEISSENSTSYTIKKTNSLDQDYNYNLNDAKINVYSRDEMLNYCGDRLKIFNFEPSEQVLQKLSFDYSSNLSYYIINISYLPSDVPPSYIYLIKQQAGASKIEYKSLNIKFYVSKTTGKFEKFEQIENYDMTVGIKVNVKYSFFGQLKYYNGSYIINK